VVEAHREGVVDVSVPPKRTPPNIANCVAPLQQQAHHLQEVLVPAHGDAVFGDAAEAGHARGRRDSRTASHVFDRLEGHAARPSAVDARQRLGSGSIFSPSMPTTPWPSFIRWCASVKPAGPMPTTSTLRPVGRGSGRRRLSGFQRVSSE
jgi:hypothetical protein